MPVPSGRAQQPGGVRAEGHGVRAAGYRSLAHPRVVGIGPQRGDGIAGAGFDPDIGRAGGEALPYI